MFKNNKIESDLPYSQKPIINAEEREKALMAIMTSAVSTEDVNNVIKSIIDETGKLFMADRCFFIERSADTNSALPIKEHVQYLSSNDIKSHASRQPTFAEIEMFAKESKRNKVSFVVDTAKANLAEATRQMLMDLSVKSYLVLPVIYGNTAYGALILHYVKDFMQFSKEDIELAKAIANQSAIIIHQAKLYNKLQQTTSKQSAILDNIPFMAWVKDTESRYLTVNKQFCESYNLKIEDIVGETDHVISSPECAEKYRNDDREVVETAIQKVMEEHIYTKNGTGWAETYKSPFFDSKGNVIGTVGLARDITEKKENEMELIHRQEQITKAAERERIIAKIVSKAVSTFDISQIQQIVKEVGAITKADRCYFLQADELDEKACIPIDAEGEYLASPDIKSVREYDFKMANLERFVKILEDTKDLVVFDYEKIRREQNDENARVNQYSELFDIKSGIGIPFFYMGKLKALLAIEYMNEKTLPSDEDLNFLRILGNQAGVAFNQIQLYKDAKASAQREKLLREIISEVSSTLDYNEIRKILVNKLGTALDSDLDVLYVKDSNAEKFLPIDEYSIHLSSDEIPNPVGINVVENYGWRQYILDNKKSDIVYQDIEKLKADYNLYGTKAEKFLIKYNVKSMIATPIVYANTFMGFLVLNFIKKQKVVKEEDVNLVKVVANQAAIALYQAKLYVQAHEASIAKSEFIANMSHEIKTPLNIILGFSEILSNSKLEPQKRINYLKNINTSGKHLLNLTNDIISISKIESGNFELKYEDCDSNQVIIDAVESIKLIAESKKINIGLDIVPANISADKKMFTQILYNLLTNAIKFTPVYGNINVKSKLDKDNLIISIEDTGIGINVENRDIIFEKFKQVDSAVDRAQQGAGLGLTITKRLVELHNGSIHVESAGDKGSLFWFNLPNARTVG